MKSAFLKRDDPIHLVPTPRKMKRGRGRMSLGARILAFDPDLTPLAGVLSAEIGALTPRTLSVSERRSPERERIGPGDIVLSLDGGLGPEEYTLEIPSVRLRLGIFSERLWNPRAGVPFEEFSARLLEADDRLNLLLLDAADQSSGRQAGRFSAREHFSGIATEKSRFSSGTAGKTS